MGELTPEKIRQGGGVLRKLQSVLHWGQEDDGLAMFTNGAHEEGMPERQVWLPQEDWLAMGEPREITVTIEPGDKLNIPEEYKPDEYITR